MGSYRTWDGKLVRDLIPEIIKENGEVPVTKILTEKEYTLCLLDKLQEEVKEFLVAENMEEMADVLEVLEALTYVLGFTPEMVQRVKQDKKEARGAFKERIFLFKEHRG